MILKHKYAKYGLIVRGRGNCRCIGDETSHKGLFCLTHGKLFENLDEPW